MKHPHPSHTLATLRDTLLSEATLESKPEAFT